MSKIGDSRAGDVFHYTWAARQSLKLLNSNSNLEKITIERSLYLKAYKDGKETTGEDVMDVTEYYYNGNINYYQLKHSSDTKDITVSFFKKTLKGFSKRFLEHKENGGVENIKFYIITNRHVGKELKTDVANITYGSKNIKYIKDHTKLNKQNLHDFCKLLIIKDDEGNYIEQKTKLGYELDQYIAEYDKSPLLDHIIAMISESFLPGQVCEINRVKILERIGISHIEMLYPASALWEESEKLIARDCYSTIKDIIINSSNNLIVSATGGVGKSTFTQWFITNINKTTSHAVAYDCFGGGKYRSADSTTRHKCKDAFMQIANELSDKGLCNLMVANSISDPKHVLFNFIDRLKSTINKLRSENSTAKLYILIDAADNARMAANEKNDGCFVDDLLSAELPDGCILVFLCRTERISMVSSNIETTEIPPFTVEETKENIKQYHDISDVRSINIESFHTLTSMNPRVQDAVLKRKFTDFNEAVLSLGSSPTTIDAQIGNVLKGAIDSALPNYEGNVIDSICYGLAVLPPNIPIDILSQLSGVSIEEINSFISELGASLRRSENAVHFKDEPTETWFIDNYPIDKIKQKEFVEKIKDTDLKSRYVEMVLPKLYLQAGMYNELIEYALEVHVSHSNEDADTNDITINCLQFAFKAALKRKDYINSIKLSLKAAELIDEGKQRINLIKGNLDLFAYFQDEAEIRRVAFSRQLRSKWLGSDNIYTAALLAYDKNCNKDARRYQLDGAIFQDNYFEYLRGSNNAGDNREDTTNIDIFELCYSYYNLEGIGRFIDITCRFNKKYSIIIIRSFIKRLLDFNKVDIVNEFIGTRKIRTYYNIIATSELAKAGINPKESYIKKAIITILSEGFFNNHGLKDSLKSDIISVLESALRFKNYYNDIRNVIDKYFVYKIDTVTAYRDPHAYDTQYANIIRIEAIKSIVIDNYTCNFENIISDDIKHQQKDNDYANLQHCWESLMPWYELRVKIINGSSTGILNETENTSSSTKLRGYYGYHLSSLPHNQFKIKSSILPLISDKDIASQYYEAYIKDSDNKNANIWIGLFYNYCRCGYVLNDLRAEIENKINNILEESKNNDEDFHISDYYVSMSRALLATSKEEARGYFSMALNDISILADNLPSKWNSILFVAELASKDQKLSSEYAYKFARCFELIYSYYDGKCDTASFIKLLTKMSPNNSITTISRWRDRDVISFDDSFVLIVHQLVKLKHISASAGWALNRFVIGESFEYNLDVCLEEEEDPARKQDIFDNFVDMSLSYGIGDLIETKNICKKHNLHNEVLESHIKDSNYEINSNDSDNYIRSSDNIDWEYVFNSMTFNNDDDISNLYERFNTKTTNFTYINCDELFNEAVKRLDYDNVWKFANLIINHQDENINATTVINLLDVIKNKHSRRVSFNSKWQSLLIIFGSIYYSDLCDKYIFESYISSLKLDFIEINILKDSIIKAMANDDTTLKDSTLYGFIYSADNHISSADALNIVCDLLDRFNKKLRPNFGEGQWSDKLFSNDNVEESMAGLIYSALGSPSSEYRWKAIYAIRQLAIYDETNIIDFLIIRAQKEDIDVYGFSEYKFYNLHALQYLLIALTGISISKPYILEKHIKFLEEKLSKRHIIIQKYTADIILNINKSTKEILDAARNITQSKLKGEYSYNNLSYWHENKLLPIERKYSLYWEFERDWLYPLGGVFSISEGQVMDIISHITDTEFDGDCHFNDDDDSRMELFSKDKYSTSFSRGPYPHTDSYNFYLIYHSIMTTASMLLEKMPIKSESHHFNEWLDSHISRVLPLDMQCKSRSYLPQRPEWINSYTDDSDWLNTISKNNYIEYIISDTNNDIWITLDGEFSENTNIKREMCNITYEIMRVNDFSSQCAINDEFSETSLISCTSQANIISRYNPYSEIIHDYKYDTNMFEESDVISSVWCSYIHYYKKDPEQQGRKLQIKLSALKEICRVNNFSIKIRASIRRNINYDKHVSNSDTYDMIIITGDGYNVC